MKSVKLVSLSLSFALLTFAATARAQRPATEAAQAPAPLVTASATSRGVRYASLGEVHQTRLQVFSPAGAQVFDSGLRLGNLIDWKLEGQRGETLPDGSYLFLLTVTDFSGGLTQKYGAALLEEGQVFLQQAVREDLSEAQSATLEASRQTKAFGPVDRIGAAGLSRAAGSVGEGDDSGSGKVQTSGISPASASTAAAETPTPTVAGTGTQGQLTKWTDNAGTLGDSVVTESAAGNIGVGTTTPNSKLHVVGALELGATSGAGVNPTIVNPNNLANYSQMLFYPASGTNVNSSFSLIPRGTGQPNNRAQLVLLNTDRIASPTNFEFASFRARGNDFLLATGKVGSGLDRPLILAAGLLTNNTTNLNQLFLATNGNVGIGTSTPGQKLSVNGVIESTTGGFRFPDGTTQTAPGLPLTGGTLTGALTLPANGLVAGTNQFVLANNNVGIGTAVPQALLHLQKNVAGNLGPILRLTNASGGGASAALDFAITNTGAFAPSARLLASDSGNYSANLIFSTKVPGGNANGLSERMRMTFDGKLGLGTVTPRATLDAVGTNGQIRFGGQALDEGGFLISNLSSEAIISGGANRANAATWIAKSTSASLAAFSGGSIFFSTNSGLTNNSAFTPQERMRIDSAGNVRIGTSFNNPTHLLDLYGPARMRVGAFTNLLINGNGSNDAYIDLIKNSNTTPSARIELNGYSGQDTHKASIGFFTRGDDGQLTSRLTIGENGEITFPPKTGYVAISSSTFQATHHSNGWSLSSDFLSPAPGAFPEGWQAPVNLPHGAVVTELQATLYDSDDSVNLELVLHSVVHSLGIAELAKITTDTTSASSSQYKVYTKNVSFTVDNSTNSYVLYFRVVNGNFKVGSIRIKYTYTKP